MEKEEIIKTINSLLIKEFEIENKELTPGTNLKDDLGLESLDFVDIAVMIKKKYGIKMKGRDVNSIKNLGELYEFIYDRVREQ